MRLHRPVPDRYAAERMLAPHVDPLWAETLLLELRMLGVDGGRIGAALAEVDSHCAESGQSAVDAFGDPRAYARSLNLAATGDSSSRDLFRAAAPTLVQVLGMFLLLPAVSAWRAGAPLEVTVGMLVALGMVVALTAAAVHSLGPVLRMIVQRPLVGWLAVMATVGLDVAALTLLPDVVAHLPARWAAGLATVLLLAGTWWLGVGVRSQLTDVVVGPLDTAPHRAGGAVESRVVRVLTVGLVPVATAVMLALTWWMPVAG